MTIATRRAKSLWSYNPIPTGCVLYLPLWHPDLRGSPFKSVDPFGHTCNVVGATKVSNGYSFDGTDDQITAPLQTAITKAGTFTICAWVNPTVLAGGVDYTLCQNTIGGLDRNSLHFKGQTINMAYFDGGGYTRTGIVISTGAWSFVLGENNGGSLAIYLNDVLGSVTETISIAAGAASLYLGINSSGNFDYNGLIGEFWVFDRTFTREGKTYIYQRTLRPIYV